MTRARHEVWIHALKGCLEENAEFTHRLKEALKKRQKMRLRVLIFGIPQRIKQLDVHDALSQIIDEITDCLFPRERGRPSPQTKDQHFWRAEGEKLTGGDERVEIEVQQLCKEVRIFKRFSSVTPYQIDLDSIWHEDPPKPDISCKLLDGTMLAFELVECVDKAIARSISGCLHLPRVFRKRLRDLPLQKHESMKEKFGNALIHVSFINGISRNKRKSSLPVILDWLSSLEGTEQGKLDPSSCRDLKDMLHWINVERAKGIAGPILSVDSATAFGNPIEHRIEEKFNQKYITESNIELLAYYELQPEIPESNWLPLVDKFVQHNIKDSVFQRVWIYSATKNEIVFVYPPL